MSAAIGPGSWVLCVNSDTIYEQAVVAGSLYCVAAIDDDVNLDPCGLCGDAGPGLLLEGFSHALGAWCFCCFRPAGRDGMFNDLLKAEPVKIGEPA